jgi:hypothetical protein
VLFTQYTDTMDFVRDELAQSYGSQVACYSGRGGETWDPAAEAWVEVPKDDIKAGFAERRYWILVCTEAASEGLNLQTSDLLINYDMPWNPMRVEQRIGRIDRIGQVKPQVRVINYYYAGSVEARIYEVLSDRLDVFRTAVGPLQPVLGSVERRIKQAALATGDAKEQAIAEQVQQIDVDIATARTTGVSVDELAQAGVSREPPPQPPCRPEDVRDVVLQSQDLAALWNVAEEEPGVYVCEAEHLPLVAACARFAFDQGVLEGRPTHVQHCLAWGDPLFETLLEQVPAPSATCWGPIERATHPDGQVEYVWRGTDGERAVTTLADLRACLTLINTPPG